MRHLEGVSEIWEGLQRNGYTLGTTERVIQVSISLEGCYFRPTLQSSFQTASR